MGITKTGMKKRSSCMSLAADPDFFDLLVSSYRRIVGHEPTFLQRAPHASAEWLQAIACLPTTPIRTLASSTPTKLRRAPSNMTGSRSRLSRRDSPPSRLTVTNARSCSTPSPAMALPRAIPVCASPSQGGASGWRTVWCGADRPQRRPRGQAATFARWRDA